MIDPESNRILELARSARTPSEADKAAVERRLATALGVWAGASAASAAAATSGKAGAGKLAGAAALKWFLPGAALIGAGALGYVALQSPAAEPSSAGVAPGRVPVARIEPAHTLAPVSAQPVPVLAPIVKKPVQRAQVALKPSAQASAPTRAERTRTTTARSTQTN